MDGTPVSQSTYEPRYRERLPVFLQVCSWEATQPASNDRNRTPEILTHRFRVWKTRMEEPHSVRGLGGLLASKKPERERKNVLESQQRPVP